MTTSRRTVLRQLGALGAWPLLGRSALAASKPHILFISIDDLNDWTGVLGGHPQANTPNVDALARSGRSFSAAHCAAPACNPSRTAVLSGVAPHRSGVYSNQAAWWVPLERTPMLPQTLRRAGYTTLAAGKVFHFGDPGAWDDVLEGPCARLDVDTPGKPTKATQLRVADLAMGPGRTPNDQAHPDARIAKWIGRRLRRPPKGRLFLACGFMKPHLPWYAPPAAFDAIPEAQAIVLPVVPDNELDDVPEAGRRLAHIETHREVVESGAWKTAVRSYLAATHFADQMLGRVLDDLAASPIRDETVVVLWSDHGWSLGEKFHWKKFALWEECTRVPLVLAGPGISAGGCDRVVSLLDVHPTLTQLAGAPVDHERQGHDLAPLLADPQATWSHGAVTTQGSRNHAIRTERFRFIRYADGSEELYDHRDDPGEHINLVGKPEVYPIQAKLRRRLPQTEAPRAPDTRGKCRPPRL